MMGSAKKIIIVRRSYRCLVTVASTVTKNACRYDPNRIRVSDLYVVRKGTSVVKNCVQPEVYLPIVKEHTTMTIFGLISRTFSLIRP